MNYSIQNNYISAVISEKGAELQSITSKETGLEYMWSGDPAFWGKKSPVLFPVIGSLKNDTYSYKEKEYTMTIRNLDITNYISIFTLN